MDSPSLSRRDFVKVTASAAAASLGSQALEGAPAPAKMKLGFDNFSIRGLGWKAPQLLDHAASLKLDVLFISDLDSYESLEESALREVRAKADGLGIGMYVGSWSICPTSTRFRKDWGTAEEHIALGLRVAKTLGSPVLRVIMGVGEDRKTPGGIEARIDDTVKVLQASRGRILDSGLKIALENHAGDMQSWELLRLIDRVGPDIVGVTIDSGNHAWTLEDPHVGLQALGPQVICSCLRDDQVWETEDGAVVQWTAIGDGLIDWKAYLAKWQELCPTVPILIETISGFQKPFPFRKPEFWGPYHDIRAQEFTQFLSLAKRGRPLEPFKAPAGMDKKQADQEYQKDQLARSVKYCKETLGLGQKA